MKLTAQKAALYYGCDVRMCDERNPELGYNYGKMIELSENKIAIDCFTYIAESMPHECQLLLTPLEKITREHAVMWYRVEFLQQREGMGDEERFLRVANWIGMKLQMSQKGADLLRSFGYDVDNSIQDGWAVDKTTLI